MSTQEGTFRALSNIEVTPTDLPAECHIRDVLGQVGDKWSILILVKLQDYKQLRFMQFKRAIPDISQRMLTQTLRRLEREGFISRSVIATVPVTVNYTLTELGLSFMQPVRYMIDWVNASQKKIEKAREMYDKANIDTPYPVENQD